MRRPRAHLVALLSLLFFAALPAQATRTLPSLADSYKTQAPLELSLRPEADVSAAEKSLRLFDEADLRFPPRALEFEEVRRERSCNYDFLTFDYDEGAGFVAESRHFDLRLTAPGVGASRASPGTRPSLFQGAWTDPLTGIAYHRNRWYDPRTASWLSEDPAGAVDSPNLYAGFAWAPHVNIDPMGDVVPKNSVVDPEHWMYRYGDKFYQHTVTGMVVELDLPNSSEHHEVKDTVLAEKIREISGKSVHGSTLTVELAKAVSEKVDYETTMTVATVYWTACAAPFAGGTRKIAETGTYAVNWLAHGLGLAGAMSGAVGALNNRDADINDVLRAAAGGYLGSVVAARIPIRGAGDTTMDILRLGARLFFSGSAGSAISQVVESDLNVTEVDPWRLAVSGATNVISAPHLLLGEGWFGLFATANQLFFGEAYEVATEEKDASAQGTIQTNKELVIKPNSRTDDDVANR